MPLTCYLLPGRRSQTTPQLCCSSALGAAWLFSSSAVGTRRWSWASRKGTAALPGSISGQLSTPLRDARFEHPSVYNGRRKTTWCARPAGTRGCLSEGTGSARGAEGMPREPRLMPARAGGAHPRAPPPAGLQHVPADGVREGGPAGRTAGPPLRRRGRCPPAAAAGPVGPRRRSGTTLAATGSVRRA